MSDTDTKRIVPPKPSRSPQSKFWIAASLLLSACILTWTFWLPLRSLSSPTAKQTELSPSEQIELKRTRAEEHREQALANHQEFVRRLVQQRELDGHKPGSFEAREYWEKRANKLKIQLQQLPDLPELDESPQKSLQWHRRAQMIDSLKDGPL